MDITYDPAKNNRNIADGGLSFDRAADFDFETAMLEIDERREYGETRIVATGYLDGRLHVICFVHAGPGSIRVISFRKANRREVKGHEPQ